MYRVCRPPPATSLLGGETAVAENRSRVLSTDPPAVANTAAGVESQQQEQVMCRGTGTWCPNSTLSPGPRQLVLPMELALPVKGPIQGRQWCLAWQLESQSKQDPLLGPRA